MPVSRNLYYFASGADRHSRPPVLLIHGAGGSHLYWPPQVRRLQDQRVFAIDLSGHGKSDGVGHHSVEEYRRDVMDFIKSIGLTGAVLVGHSMGAAVALDAAIRCPENVLGLCVVGGGARLHVAPDILRSSADSATFPAAVNLIRDLAFAPQTSIRLQELAKERMAQTRPSVLHGDFLACDSFDVAQRLAAISTPTLIVCGESDRMTPPAFSAYLRDRIPGATLEVVPNAGHMVMLEQPELFSDILARFVDGLAYRPGG